MGYSIPTNVHTLVSTAQSTLGRHKSSPDSLGHEIRHLLGQLNPLPPLSGWFPKSTHPATSLIGGALKGGTDATSSLLDALTPVIRHLPWRYPQAGGTEERIAIAELIGPDAPFRSPAVGLGFALIAPNAHCPVHHHSAAELYYMVTGTATWLLDGMSHVIRPGTCMLLPSQSVHAVRTDDDAVLALYARSASDARNAPEYSI